MDDSVWIDWSSIVENCCISDGPFVISSYSSRRRGDFIGLLASGETDFCGEIDIRENLDILSKILLTGLKESNGVLVIPDGRSKLLWLISKRCLLFVVAVGSAIVDAWRWGVLSELPIESRLDVVSCSFEELIEVIPLGVDEFVVSLISDAILFLYTKER